MSKRELQIDVITIGEEIHYKDMVRCNIYIDGRCCTFWTTQSNYEALKRDRVFIRHGNEKDSANVINTTNMFIERQ